MSLCQDASTKNTKPKPDSCSSVADCKSIDNLPDESKYGIDYPKVKDNCRNLDSTRFEYKFCSKPKNVLRPGVFLLSTGDGADKDSEASGYYIWQQDFNRFTGHLGVGQADKNNKSVQFHIIFTLFGPISVPFQFCYNI